VAVLWSGHSFFVRVAGQRFAVPSTQSAPLCSAILFDSSIGHAPERGTPVMFGRGSLWGAVGDGTSPLNPTIVPLLLSRGASAGIPYKIGKTLTIMISTTLSKSI
jgi:hypothetical protein